MNSPKTQAAVDQLTSLIHLVSSQMDPTKSVTDREKLDWLQSAMKGKKNLIQYLSVKVIMDKDKSKNEHRLSLLLLALVVRMATNLTTSDEECPKAVLSDLTRTEEFWSHVLSLLSCSSQSVSVRCNALNLLVNAYRLNRSLADSSSQDWPILIFSEATVKSVVDLLVKHHLSGGFSMDTRLMTVCLEYLVLAFRNHSSRVRSAISNAPTAVLTGLLETGGQLLLAGPDRVEFFGFDPLVAEIELKLLRTLVNELIDIGGEKIYTPLALLCIESTPVTTPAKGN